MTLCHPNVTTNLKKSLNSFLSRGNQNIGTYDHFITTDGFFLVKFYSDNIDKNTCQGGGYTKLGGTNIFIVI